MTMVFILPYLGIDLRFQAGRQRVLSFFVANLCAKKQAHRRAGRIVAG
jgi:hypothetical protein